MITEVDGGAHVNSPDSIPAQPIPASARPTMKKVDDGAIPQRSEPNWKIATPPRKIYFTEKSVNNMP